MRSVRSLGVMALALILVCFPAIAAAARPTAVLDGPTTAALNASITLSGARSSDSDGSLVQYRFRDALTGATQTTASPSFTLPMKKAGTHRFILVVVDNSGASSDPVYHDVVVSAGQAPTAVLDAPTTARVGQTVTLSGSRSSDSDGTIVAYDWTNLATGTTVRTTAPSHTVTLTTAGQARYQLVVTDNTGLTSLPDSIIITVANNERPTAVLDAPATARVGQAVTLSGSRSFDTDGTIVAYDWTNLATGTTVRTTAPSHTVTLTTAGRANYQLVVTDNSGLTSLPDTIIITVANNERPTAVLDAPTTARIGQTVTLSGSRSFDTDGTIVAYDWTNLASGVTARTTTPTRSATLVTAGQARYQLVVTDNSGLTSLPDSIIITVANNEAPTAVLDGPTSARVNTPVSFSGSRSFDTDGRVTAYIFTNLTTGQTFRTSSPTANLTFTTTGRHQVRLVVVDDSGLNSMPYILTISIAP